MIYSTTHHRIPGDPLLLREAPGAVRRRSASSPWSSCCSIDYRALRDYSMVVLRRDRASCCSPCSRRSARTSRVTRRGSSCPVGFTLQPSELAKFGIIVALAGYCNQYRGELDAWRLTVIIGAGRASRSGSCCSSPTSGPYMVLVVIIVALLAVAGRERAAARRARAARDHRRLRGRQPRAAEAVPARPAHRRSSIPRAAPARAPRTTRSSRSRRSRTGGSPARVSSRAPRPRAASCPSSTPTSSSPSVGEELGFVGAVVLLALFAIVMWRTWRTARLVARLLRHARVRRRARDVRVPDLREHRA